ncbi:ComEC/Rec2 family competence protein [Helicobacter pametensis]|uniref:ComEC/Rec2 family competence protein n=1 Tax=Helicobacter pametensis TaxID=95149 RepID=UPI0004B37670|nr:ComEC/Rec2 family competence protein [Helicobacter pametensis]
MSSRIAFVSTTREWGIILGVLCLILALMLGWRFWTFQTYIKADKQRLEARILNQYYKNHKWVLKLKATNGLILYTTSKEDLKDLQNRTISIFGKPAKCSFYDSFRSCFFITFSFDVMPKDWRSIFYDYIASQHQDEKMSKLYQTLFFASSLSKEWRDLSTSLKIAHLLAISGLHLGILAFVFYLFLSPIYQFLHSRFFSYRNHLFDLGVLLHIALLGYLFLLDFPPAFLRAYVMSLMGFLFFYFHFALLNFSFLALCALLILALFPHFFFSIGFWFSLSGVFYILLFFKYCSLDQIRSSWIKALVILCLLNLVLFFNMLPLTHLFFPTFALYSWLAIPLSILFAPFFVLVFILHLVGFGGILDPYLLPSLTLSFDQIAFLIPWWVGLVYVGISLGAIFSRLMYFCSLGAGFTLWVYLVSKML